MIYMKPGVEFTTIAPAGFLILQALKTVSRNLGVNLTITSACDGDHSGPTDPHKSGEAYDVRSHDFGPLFKDHILSEVMTELGKVHFFGFLEAPGEPNEHFHFQRAKGTTFGLEDFFAF